MDTYRKEQMASLPTATYPFFLTSSNIFAILTHHYALPIFKNANMSKGKVRKKK